MKRTLRRNKTTHLVGLGLLVWALATSCGMCDRVDTAKPSGTTAKAFAELAPKDVSVAVFVGDFKKLRGSLTALKAGMGEKVPVEGALGQFKQRYGLDLTDVAAIKAKGIRVEDGFAAVVHEKQLFFYVPVESKTLFEQFMTGLAKERHGAEDQPTIKTLGNDKVWVMQTKLAGGVDAGSTAAQVPRKVVMAWMYDHNTAIIFPGQEMAGNDGEALKALEALRKATTVRSLAADPGFKKLKESVGASYPAFGIFDLPGALEEEAKGLDEYTYGKEEAARIRNVASNLGRVGFGLDVDEQRARVHVLGLMKPEAIKRLNAALTAAPAPKGFAKALDGTPVITLSLAVDPGLALNEFMALLADDTRKDVDAGIRMAKTLGGVDVRGQLLPALDGHGLVAIYSAEPSAIAALTRGRFDDFLAGAEVALTFGLKNRAKVEEILTNVAKSTPGSVKEGQLAGKKVFFFAADRNAFLTPTEPQGKPQDGTTAAVPNPAKKEAPTGQPVPPGQASPAQSTEVPEGTFATLVLGDKNLTLASRKMALNRALKIANFEGSGPTGPLANPTAGTLISANNSTGVVVDVQGLLGQLGLQAMMFEQSLRPFSLWILSAKPATDGVALDLDLSFAKPAAKKTDTNAK